MDYLEEKGADLVVKEIHFTNFDEATVKIFENECSKVAAGIKTAPVAVAQAADTAAAGPADDSVLAPAIAAQAPADAPAAEAPKPDETEKTDA